MALTAAEWAIPATVLAVLVAFVAVGVPATVRRGRARTAPAAPAVPSSTDRPLPAAVVNPTKFADLPRLHREISRTCAELGWADPLWFETTAEDPGGGQAKAALAAGADLVLACGGDGTIRCVAQVLAGSGTPLGLLPAGTGNLLARNLSVQFEDVPGAVRAVLVGQDRAVDVGWLRLDDRDEEHAFLVMAGMGFDAAIMAGARAELKARVGPLAYVISGLQALQGQRVRIGIGVDAEPELRRRVRTVVVGNCGRLLAGLVLMPAARFDDGLLDVVTIAPKGLIGWIAVAARVLTRRRTGHPLIEHWQGSTVTIAAERSQPAQLDGDLLGEAQRMRFRVDRGALLVRGRAAIH